MIEIIAIFIPAIFLYVYMILSSIEYGVSLFQLFPTLLGNDKVIKSYIQPVWEVTNVFLVFCIVSLFTFFPRANYYLGTYLLVPLFLGLLFLGFRSLCMLLIFYANINNKAINILFFCASFLAPIAFSQVYVYILTGDVTQLFLKPLSIFLDILIISSILLISSTFFEYYSSTKKQNKKIQTISLLSAFSAFFAVGAFLFFLMRSNQYILSDVGHTIVAINAILLSFLFLLLTQLLRKYQYAFWAACIFIECIFFSVFFMQLPYFIYPNITIYNSVTDVSMFPLFGVSFFIGMLFVLPGLWLLYYLFFKKR